MARKSKSSGKSKPAPKRAAKPEPQEQVLEEVDSGGWGIDEGILFTTFVLLAGACTMVWMMIQDRFPDPI